MPVYLHEQLEHGHSEMVHLLDEVEAHAVCLNTPLDEVILEGLIFYLNKFAGALRAHIVEEERDVFPRLKSDKSVEHLELQHEGLLHWLDEVERLLGSVQDGGAKELASTISLMRRDFVKHSADEREALRRSESNSS